MERHRPVGISHFQLFLQSDVRQHHHCRVLHGFSMCVEREFNPEVRR
jgi:hypothetical protein